jgi:hypothetical protein
MTMPLGRTVGRCELLASSTRRGWRIAVAECWSHAERALVELRAGAATRTANGTRWWGSGASPPRVCQVDGCEQRTSGDE